MLRRTCISVAVALASIVSTPVLACVADTFTLDRLATESAYVVTATVSEVRSSWTPDHMTIETTVTLTGVERITRDGSVAEPDVTYTVLGGTVGDETLRVCCAPAFRAGERWVLFLQREYRQYPVLGMERGMFRIAEVDGAPARVRTSGGAPIASIGADGAIEVRHEDAAGPAERQNTRQPVSVRGNIRAVHIVDRGEAAIDERTAPVNAEVTLDAFLSEIRARLPERVARDGEVEADIEITRIHSNLVAVPLKGVPAQKAGGAR